MVRPAHPESAIPAGLTGCAMSPTLQNLASGQCFMACARCRKPIAFTVEVTVLVEKLLSIIFLICVVVGSGIATADAFSVPRGQLPRNVLPTHYALALRIDPRHDGFTGEVRIKVRVAESTARFWMHAKGLDIAHASYRPEGGAELPLKTAFADVSGVLRVDADSPLTAGMGELHFKYRARYGTQLDGTYKVKLETDSYVMTQMESISARTSFPCFDEPSFKTPWDIELTVPTTDQAVANTRMLSMKKLRGGWKRLRFATTESLPTYLIAYAVGPWDIVTAAPVPANAQRKVPLPLRGIAVKGRGKELAYALETTPEIVTALEAYFDSPFPFDKLDLLAAPDFGSGAMENAGLIIFKDSFLLINKQSPTFIRQGYFETNVHELAHQWFGDLVTMPWWDDLWLNEGFATWMASKITTQLRPEFHSDRKRLQSTIFAMGQDALAASRQVREPIKNFTDIESAFDGITYSKGAAVLSMFESHLGAEPFRTAVRDYLSAHARGNATSDDLIHALAARSTQPAQIAAAFRSFLDQSGVPFLAIDVQCDNGKAALAVRQSRYLPLGSSASAARTWGVPLCLRYADVDGVHKHCALLESANASIALPSASCPSWVMPNANATGYYRYALSSESQRALDGAFAQLNEREQRIVADALNAAFENGSVPLADYLAAVPLLAAASTRQVALAPARTLSWLRENRVADAAESKALQKFVGAHYNDLLQRLGFDARAEDDDEARLTRASVLAMMSDEARDATIRKELAARARRLIGMGGDKPDPTAINKDSHDNALRVLVQDGGAVEFNAVEARFRASVDSVEREQYLLALGSATDPKLQSRALALTLDPTVQSGEVTAVLWAAARFPETRAGARLWLRAHLNAVSARIPPGEQRFLAMTEMIGTCSGAEADAAEAFWGPRFKDVEGGPRMLAQSVEFARVCSALRAHYAKQDLRAALQTSIGKGASSAQPSVR